MTLRTRIMAGLAAVALTGAVLGTGPASAQLMRVKAAEPLNLYAEPSADGAPVITIPPGWTMPINGCTEDFQWCKVVYRGQQGWVEAGQINSTRPDFRDRSIAQTGKEMGLPMAE